MLEKSGYHHGDLRAALIAAGEELLQETGVERFSLRQVARKVGVSHSAPAHHFGDSNGLLNAIADDGFRRLLISMQTHHKACGPDLQQALVGSGLGYIAFARSAPSTFGLMFGPYCNSSGGESSSETATAAFEHLACSVERLKARTRSDDPEIMTDIIACWSMVHGLSDLLISGGLQDLHSLPSDQQDIMFKAMIARALPF